MPYRDPIGPTSKSFFFEVYCKSGLGFELAEKNCACFRNFQNFSTNLMKSRFFDPGKAILAQTDMKFEFSVKNCAGYMVLNISFDAFFFGAVWASGKAILGCSGMKIVSGMPKRSIFIDSNQGSLDYMYVLSINNT